jgi:hypothetical protein
VGLQETIKKNYSDKFFRNVDPGKEYSWNWIPACGRVGAILCGVKLDKFDILSYEVGCFSIVADVRDKKLNKNWTLAPVSGPTHEERRELFLTEISLICCNRKAPVIRGGDFNILRYSSEKNKNFSGNRFADMFNCIINTHNLRDIHMNGGKYTWSNNQEYPTLE